MNKNDKFEINNGWTPERRRRQAERCRQNKPWQKSTGPRSDEGKNAAKMNACKHGMYSAPIKELERLLRLQKLFLDQFM